MWQSGEAGSWLSCVFQIGRFQKAANKMYRQSGQKQEKEEEKAEERERGQQTAIKLIMSRRTDGH